MPVPQITALPDPPSRQDPTNFAVKGDAFLGALPDFATEANALATQVNERVDAAFDAGLEGAATNAATTVTKAAEARASELAAAGFANEAMLLSLGVETLRPSIKPSLLLDFARAQVVPPSVTFTRASTATRVGPSGLIETVGVNVPRIDFDPATGLCDFLIEEQRTNQYTHSEQLNDASWGTGNTVVTPNSGASPDGQNNADLLVFANTSTSLATPQGVTKGVSVVQNSFYTMSCYAKNNGAGFVKFHLTTGATDMHAYFDLNTLQSGALGHPTPYANLSTKIEPCGNGIFRLILIFQSIGANTTLGTGISSSLVSGVGSTYLRETSGNGVDGVYVWGASFETGNCASSYIPTTTSAVTRIADSADVLNITPWYRTDEGTLYVEFSAFGLPATFSQAYGAALNSGSPIQNVTAINHQVTLGSIRGVSTSSTGSSQASLTQAGSATGRNKAALAIKLNDFAFSVNGNAPAVDPNGIMPIPNRLSIGRLLTTIGNVRVSKVAYYPKRLSNAEIQAMTTL